MIEPIHSKDGNTYWIESGDTLYKERLQHGQYQKTNWSFAQTVLPRTRTCIDIGSNNACNAVNYSKVFDNVECFEPTPLAQKLWHNTVFDCGVKNCTLHTDALGEQDTTSEILLHERNGGHNHLQHWDKNPRAKRERSSKSTVQVNVTTLDSYNFESVDFIKIDVEGYEWFVLQGAELTLQRERPMLQLEIVNTQCRKFNYAPEQMIDWLRNRDYRVCSKRDGWLGGEFRGEGSKLLYNSVPRKGDMDLFFIPCEWNHQLEPAKELFELE